MIRTRRLVQLYAGLLVYGVSAALQVRASLGLDPWDVLHQGLARHLGLQIGTVSVLVGAMVLVFWIPLRLRPGLGTVSNVVLIGSTMDAALAVLPTHPSLVWRFAELAGGIVLCGLATGLYIGARFGTGPRDGLMTGIARRSGLSIRVTRTGIEVTVLTLGWLLGGQVGVGTALFAVAIGPLAQLFLPMFSIPETPVVTTDRTGVKVSRPRRRPRGPTRWPAARRRSRTPGADRRRWPAGRPTTRC